MTLQRATAFLFAALALATGLAVAAITPVGQVADEPNHILRAESLTHGVLVGTTTRMRIDGVDMKMATVAADAGLMRMANVAVRDRTLPMSRTLLAEMRQTGWAHQTLAMPIGPLAAYMPALYAPAAALLGLARVTGVAPYDAVVAGRVLNLLLFVAAGTLALALAPRGRAMMLCALSVPMTLSLAASFNQDGLLIAASALATALAARAAEQARRDIGFWVAALLIAVVGMAKPPYLALGAMLVLPLPPLSTWRDDTAFWGRIGVAALACLPGLLWMGLAVPQANGVIPRAVYEAGPLWPGPRPALFHSTDLGAQLRVLLADPWRFVWLPTVSFWGNANLIHEGFGVLGWLNVVFAEPFYNFWEAIVVLAVLGDALRPGSAGGRGPKPLESLLLVLAVVACIWAIYLSQYLAWTDVGAVPIVGPTGRYLLPLVPMLALAVPRIRGAGRLGTALTVLPLLALAAGLFIVPRALLAAFYS